MNFRMDGHRAHIRVRTSECQKEHPIFYLEATKDAGEFLSNVRHDER